MMKFMPSFKMIELCLTYRCNVKCANCSNLCTQAPTTGDLTPVMVENFIKDSIDSNHIWGQITLHGGEPVLNPWIYDIVKLLVKYSLDTGCKLWLLSNNSSPKIRETISRISLRYDIPLGISEKKSINADAGGNPIEYIPVNESPTDIGLPFTHGCFQSKTCGVCFNYMGYFPCSPMAAAARVFNYSPAAASIKDLTENVCIKYFAMHCKNCGFAMPDRRRVTTQLTTETWQKAFDECTK